MAVSPAKEPSSTLVYLRVVAPRLQSISNYDIR
jgi:hypothetical protein